MLHILVEHTDLSTFQSHHPVGHKFKVVVACTLFHQVEKISTADVNVPKKEEDR